MWIAGKRFTRPKSEGHGWIDGRVKSGEFLRTRASSQAPVFDSLARRVLFFSFSGPFLFIFQAYQLFDIRKMNLTLFQNMVFFLILS